MAVLGNMMDSGRRILQSIRPSFLSKEPHFNFITVHYFWIIGMSIVGSILIFASGKGNLSYIDSLYFASGANTQAGLNPVDVNLLNTFQQVVIFLMAMMSNPISINSAVVFLRLYWFEKRFQGIVADARSKRISVAKSRSKAKPATADVEKGVGGKDIRVMHNTASRMTNDGIILDHFSMNGAIKSDPSEEHMDPAETNLTTSPTAQRDTQIRFADNVRRSDAIPSDDEESVPLPHRRSNTEHIAILERQRKQERGGTLRIPGPRDAERGVGPEELSDEEDYEGDATGLNRLRRGSSAETAQQRSAQGRPHSHVERQQTIIFEEQDHPKRHEIAQDLEAAAHTAAVFKPHKPRGHGEKLHHTMTRTDTESRHNPLSRIKTALSQHKEADPAPYLSWQPTIGRNSEFLDLTEEQREELGGIEYRSLKTLAVVVTGYFWGFWIFGLLCLWPWIAVNNEPYSKIVEAAGASKAWWSFFTSNSAFTDLGFTLTSDSMTSFNKARFPLLIMSFLIIAGNTGFPILLRFSIWFVNLFVPRTSGLYEELRFLLDHPRRCFTLLFPSAATWWLFLILIILNLVDLIFFIILDLGSGPVAELPLDIRFLDGWFQAASTRTAGFAVLNLSQLHPAVQTSYLIMMYISVFPIAISVRRTNVYEEKALGLYGSGGDNEEQNGSGFSYVGAHLRRQLSFDLWYIFIGYFILTISEGPRLINNDFSMFAVLFEVVSAYGTVGLSLGYTGINASLCSQFTVVGKLVMIAMQIRGRHRGLPYGLDRAILLPSEHLNRKEAEDAEAKLQRRMSATSLVPDRGANLTRGRSRSVDRPNMLTQFLHPGPAYPTVSHTLSKSRSMARSERSVGMGTYDSIRRTTTEPPSDENDSVTKGVPGPRRASTQPASTH
ncbi:potassium transport protein TRK1/TRK2 [Apiospora aurea]|uniref:Potassium transport protein n=1 Tax=Apiospora aurea TaxID=335848 RepID=A0ABR1PUF3_9PEZI